MLILLSILLGMLIADILCSPNTYYPYLILMMAVFPAIIYFSRKTIFKYSKLYYLTALLSIIAAYLLTSYAIFHIPRNQPTKYSSNGGNKTAVIFFAPGEMVNFSLNNAGNYLTNESFMSKPYICYKIKKYIKSVSQINQNLIMTADKIKTSVLNHDNYLFYTSLSNDGNPVDSVISRACSDGCNKILIINYSDIPSSSIYSSQKTPQGVMVKVSPPVYESQAFIENLISKIGSSGVSSDGIYIIDNLTPGATLLKDRLIQLGYNKNYISLSKSLSNADEFFKANKLHKVHFINLMEGNNFESDFSYQSLLNSNSNDIICINHEASSYSESNVISAINVFKEMK